jgi:hypothetical protein
MAIKKTSGGDSPLRQGARKSFWTLPISGRQRRQIAMYSGKVIGSLGFSHRGVFIGEEAASKVGQGGLTTRGAGQPWVHRPVVWPPCGPSPSPLRFSRSSGKFLDVWLLFRPIPRIFPV